MTGQPTFSPTTRQSPAAAIARWTRTRRSNSMWPRGRRAPRQRISVRS